MYVWAAIRNIRSWMYCQQGLLRQWHSSIGNDRFKASTTIANVWFMAHRLGFAGLDELRAVLAGAALALLRITPRRSMCSATTGFDRASVGSCSADRYDLTT